MTNKTCILIGAPVQDGTGRLGCDMGPSAFRAAGIGQALESLGHRVIDTGNLVPEIVAGAPHANAAIRSLPEIAGWTRTLAQAVLSAHAEGLPIVLGGDHSLAAGTLSGHARQAARAGRKLFVLWLDAHPDLHTLDTTTSGNLHGVPMAYALGLPGFAGHFPALESPLDPQRICMMGLRSVDPAERRLLAQTGIRVHDMRAIDENGVATLLRGFLDEVERQDGLLHVSLDVDFLDPEIAPGVGTTVPGGATFREAHLIMEMLHDSDRVTSLDLVELNPFLDDRGRTARLMVDLTASLLGRSVLDRPTRSY
jgi:arginase